jgi:hypothetical protein
MIVNYVNMGVQLVPETSHWPTSHIHQKMTTVQHNIKLVSRDALKYRYVCTSLNLETNIVAKNRILFRGTNIGMVKSQK